MRKSLVLMNILFLFLFLFLLNGCLNPPKNFSEKKWQQTVKDQKVSLLYAPHKKDGLFYNPWLAMPDKGFFSVLRWKFTKGRSYTPEEKKFLPQTHADPVFKIKKLKKNQDFVLWIGHNTFLLRLAGVFYMTDPIFSQRALLPKRVTQPGLTMKQLLSITSQAKLVVIITHNHYDHLDEKSIEKLPQGTKFIVPLGVDALIQDWGHKNIVTLDWWQSAALKKGHKITAMPAQHWSRRINQSTNKSLWASYMVQTKDMKIYFAGDSGYFIGYKEIGRKHPDIDYAFIPITAYHPRWFMHYPHMDVTEALQAFQELKADYFIPTQWGTFPLGDNPPGYPGLDLQRQIKKKKLDSRKFLVLGLGEVKILNKRKSP